MAKRNFQEVIEQQEIIQKLIDNGFGELVEAFLSNEGEVYTKKGRLNKSGACRVLDWKTSHLEAILRDAKELVKDDFDLEEN